MGSQTSTRGGWNVKYIGLFLHRKRYINCYLHKSLGEGVVNSLVTSVLYVRLKPHWNLPWTLNISLFVSIYRLHFYEGVLQSST